MRRLIRLASFCGFAALLIVSSGCKKKRERPVHTSSEPAGIATMIQVGDPRSAAQLTKGFYAIENGSWRWTARAFSVTLRPPLNAGQNGARLVLKFAIPDVILNQLHTMKLAAKVNGIDLPPEEYTRPGEQTYSRDVPAVALPGSAVAVEFTLDKALPPSGSDNRELGVIVSSVGFEAK